MDPRLKQGVLLLMIILLSSCLPTNEIEHIGIATIRGTDLIDENKIEVTMGMYEFNSSSNQSSTVSGRSHTIEGAINNANMKTSFELSTGKVQVDMFDKELAEKGLMPYLDPLGRDAIEPDMMYMAVSEIPTKELLKEKREAMETVNINIGQHLQGLIDQSSPNNVFPKINYSDFLEDITDTGKEGVLPVLDFVEGTPTITSMAVFKGDRYVGDLDLEYRLPYILLQKSIKEEKMNATIPLDPFLPYIEGKVSNEKELYTTLYIVKGGGVTKLRNKKELTFETDISIELNLVEISEQIQLTNPKAIDLLEVKVGEKVKKQYEQMLDELKELHSDALGYGAHYRMKDGDLTQEEWDEMFPDIDVNFNIDVNITHHGEHF